jgi:hypothetical protein
MVRRRGLTHHAEHVRFITAPRGVAPALAP